MSASTDDILAQELGKIGELGGRFGALFTSTDSKAAGEAASLGAQFAAQFLPTESHTEKLDLKVAPEKALKLAFSVLARLGEVQADDNKTLYPFLKAVVHSGFVNMNPAVVYVEILEGDSTSCEVTITAAAKEGLIKQHTAGKAAQRVASMLRGIVEAG